MSEAAKKNETPVVKLLGGRLKRAEFERTVYSVVPDDGTSRKRVMEPDFWAHVGKILRPRDAIEVTFTGDNAGMLELIVVDAGPLWAKVVEKSWTPFQRQDFQESSELRKSQEDNAEYEVIWGSPSIQYCVVRKTDKERIFTGLANKEEAQKKLDDYVKALAA